MLTRKPHILPDSKAHRLPRRSGQALVEMALLTVILGLLLAGAVDLGRAYYTMGVVTDMAGEGAAYAALYPYLDYDDQSCSSEPVELSNSIQERTRKVAREHGLVIKEQDQREATIAILVGNQNSCRRRCVGSTVSVKVTYRINDVFLPGLLGMRSILI